MMKKIIVLTIFISIFGLTLPTSSFAQSQQQEEQNGKKFVDDLSNKLVTCSQLKDGDFEKIGEYFMGKMVGSSHEAMNTMMVGMMGKVGEEQMHVVMGKRLSGCDSNAPISSNMMGGMMSMMMGSGPVNTPWMWGFGLLFVIFSLIFSVLILIILILFTIWLWKQIQKK